MRPLPLARITGIAAPLLRDNINTDVIIPSREMKTVSRKGLAGGLFADWRYAAVNSRMPNPDFVLNCPRFADATILIAGNNFGCGSSREHAAWALAEYGFKAVIAESFNPIFRGNAVLNGIVPVILPREWIDHIATQIAVSAETLCVTIDLDGMFVDAPGEPRLPFTLDEGARAMLREGHDTIDLTLRHRDAITAFRDADKRERPWAYPE